NGAASAASFHTRSCSRPGMSRISPTRDSASSASRCAATSASVVACDCKSEVSVALEVATSAVVVDMGRNLSQGALSSRPLLGFPCFVLPSQAARSICEQLPSLLVVGKPPDRLPENLVGHLPLVMLKLFLRIIDEEDPGFGRWQRFD